MHRALAVPEIVDLIASNVEEKDTLANMARVSRSCHPSAIRWLWFKVDQTAVYVLCRDLLAERDEDGSFTPVKERMSRFHSYSSLVCDLYINFWDDVDGTNSDDESVAFEDRVRSPLFDVLRRAALLLQIPCLLPKLKKLHFDLFDPETLELAPLFLSSTLESIYIDSEGQQESISLMDHVYELPMSYILERLRLCNSLKSFRTNVSLDIHGTAMAEVIRDCPRLSALNVEGESLTPPVFAALASHPSLRTLCVPDPAGIDLLTCEGWDAGRCLDTPFASLASLSIECLLGVGMQVLNFIPVSLEDITLGLSSKSDKPISKSLAMQLSSVFDSHTSTLRNLDLRLSGAFETHSKNRIDFKSVSGFTKCHRLTKLYFHMYSSTSLDLQDNDISDLAKALPGLTDVSLTWEPWDGKGGLYKPNALTLKSIRHLAKCCKGLQHIGFSSLCSRSYGLPPAIRPRSGSLTLRLDAQDSEASHPAILAAFLASIWPNICVSVQAYEKFSSSWKALCNVLEGIQLTQKMKDTNDPSATCTTLCRSLPQHKVHVRSIPRPL